MVEENELLLFNKES